MARKGQIERISRYESILDEIAAKVKDLNGAIAAFDKIAPKIKELSDYYGSSQWKRDFADDEAGKLPPDLKRGVLSEDAVYNLLEEVKELCEMLGKADTDGRA